MKNKNFVKIIFVVVLLVGMFFVAYSTKAEVIQCCFVKSGSVDHIEEFCRLKGNTSCRLSSICIETRTQKVCVDRICSDEDVCIKYAMEQQVNCTAEQECKNAVTKNLKNCDELKNPADCNITSSLCFWSTNLQDCFGLNDVNNCPGFNKADCARVEACTWEPPNDPNGSCLNPLSKGVRDQYGESRGDILPSCAASGQCRSLSNILYTVLNIVKLVFRYVGAIAFIFFVYGGFTMILSFGNAEKFKKGQQVLVAAVIGLIIVFGAYLMITFVLEALGVSEEFKAIK